MRSLELDVKEWSAPVVGLMSSIGNERLNAVWMAAAPPPPPQASPPVQDDGMGAAEQEVAAKPPPATPPAAAAGVIHADSDKETRTAHIRQKYEGRRWVGGPAPSPAALHLAAQTDDVALAAAALAHGHDLEAKREVPRVAAAGEKDQNQGEA